MYRVAQIDRVDSAEEPVDLLTETLFPLLPSEFNKYWPGRGVQRGALHRYTSKGIKVPGIDKPVVLESIMLSSMRYSSVEAVKRFIAAQNRPFNSPVHAIRDRSNAD